MDEQSLTYFAYGYFMLHNDGMLLSLLLRLPRTLSKNPFWFRYYITPVRARSPGGLSKWCGIMYSCEDQRRTLDSSPFLAFTYAR